jgi:hypothetical protein
MIVDFSTLGLPEHARWLAETINDYDDRLSLEKLPPGHPWLQDQPDKPYAIIHRPTHAPEYVVESFPESMLDERLLAIVFEADMNRAGRKLDRFDALGHAARLKQERLIADRKASAADRFEYLQRRRTERGKVVIG